MVPLSFRSEDGVPGASPQHLRSTRTRMAGPMVPARSGPRRLRATAAGVVQAPWGHYASSSDSGAAFDVEVGFMGVVEMQGIGRAD